MQVRNPSDPLQCVVCGAEIRFDGRFLVGEVLDCERCGAALEVVEPRPLRLQPLARIEDDFDELE
jgi:lysine biosynthesis protein LysW